MVSQSALPQMHSSALPARNVLILLPRAPKTAFLFSCLTSSKLLFRNPIVPMLWCRSLKIHCVLRAALRHHWLDSPSVIRLLPCLLRSAAFPPPQRTTTLRSVQNWCNFSSFNSSLSLLPSQTESWSGPHWLEKRSSLQMESASDSLPSPSCLPCPPIGPYSASVSAGQITAVTLTNQIHKHARTQTEGNAQIPHTKRTPRITRTGLMVIYLKKHFFCCHCDDSFTIIENNSDIL